MHIQKVQPGPGQESVWDYPRPPVVQPTDRHLQVIFNGEVVADTTRGVRVLETSHPPVYYFPPEDVRTEALTPTSRSTYCEYKGEACYYRVGVGERSVGDGAWCYPSPAEGYEDIAGYFAFYPAKMDACSVDGVTVRPQPGDYYGGWVTPDIVGPFKGEPGTLGW